ncbi:MAG TPA: hypothetical protein VMF35_18300 [Acidimicrobiales bacterium]|nr:hypothetical protein [Acidimicrobiales bacterium]
MISENWIYFGTAVGALGALVYLRDTVRGTTQPNRVTWLLWAFAPLLAAGVEFHDGVGLRALPTFMVGFMPLLIFVASFHNAASVWKVRRIDYACGAFSLVGTVVWFATQNGVLAISAALAADFLAGVPTLMKSWTHPQTETVHSYIGAVISMAIVLLTITDWTFEEAAFPVLVVIMGSVEVLLIGFEPGPRLQRARRHTGAAAHADRVTESAPQPGAW